jgi:hypothetical protein
LIHDFGPLDVDMRAIAVWEKGTASFECKGLDKPWYFSVARYYLDGGAVRLVNLRGIQKLMRILQIHLLTHKNVE